MIGARLCAAVPRPAARLSTSRLTAARAFTTTRPARSGLSSLLKVSEEITDAVATHKPVVALESTIYTHGMMGKGLAAEHDALVRSHGGIPAIIAIVDGVPTVGTTHQDIVRMIESGSAVKASRRDVAYIAGMVRPTNPFPSPLT